MNKREQLLQTFHKLVPEEANFRKDQKSAIDQILAGHDVLTIMPTGGGKSICYQVPAMLLPGVTLVISPLLALMEDQVKRLLARGFPVACLSSEFIVDRDGFHYYRSPGTKDDPDFEDFVEPDFAPDPTDEETLAEIAEAVAKQAAMSVLEMEWESGEEFEVDDFGNPIVKDATVSFRKLRNQIFLDTAHGNYKLLYVTPERLRHGAFIRFAKNVEISMIAVDEAHCISLWGYDFRPRYLEISRLLTRIGYHPIIAAFTATATDEVRKDIVKLLGMKDHVEIKRGSVRRPNLQFSVHHFETTNPDPGDKDDINQRKCTELFQYIQEKHESSGLVYCSSVKSVKEVYQHLKEHGIEVTRYFAKLDKDPQKEEGESKQKNFDDFLTGKKKVMVSTTALGMGIDKKDIRFVIHYNLPTCLENYYQEAGRVGRDKQEADCILYYSENDIEICRKLIKHKSSELSEKDLVIREKIDQIRLEKMIQYAKEGASKNSGELQGQIIKYFNAFDPYKQDPILRLLVQDNDLAARIKRIDVLYANRTKIANNLRKGHMAETLEVGTSSSGFTVSYRVTGERLTYFDLMVADAVYTLMEHRVPTIYAKTVMELLSGNENLMLRPERKKQVEDSILKMIRTNIEIDRSKSAKYGFTYGENKLVLHGAFLPLREKKKSICLDSSADNTGRGFVYDDGVSPPLYEYAELLNGQFYSFPTKYLRVKKKVPKDGKNKYLPTTFENLSMIHYLLCLIDAANSPTLLFDDFDKMITELGISIPDKTRDHRIKTLWNEKMLPILEHFKDSSFIQEYEAVYEDKSVWIERRRPR